MKVKLLDRKINEIEADFEVILVVDKNLNHEFIKDADKFALKRGRDRVCKARFTHARRAVEA